MLKDMVLSTLAFRIFFIFLCLCECLASVVKVASLVPAPLQ